MMVTRRAMELIVQEGYDQQYGARPLRRAVARLVDDALADAVLKQVLQREMIAVLDVDSMDDEKLIVHPFATREAAIKAFDFSRGGNADEDAGSEEGSTAEGKNNTIVFSSVKLTTLEV